MQTNVDLCNEIVNWFQYCLLEYPHLVLTTVGVKKDVECEPCKRLGKQGSAAFKLAFHGKCYDPDTLAVVDKDGAAWPVRDRLISNSVLLYYEAKGKGR